MLTALNTGHEGGSATIHANAAEAVPGRLAALGALAGMQPAAVHSQMLTAIDLVIHLRRVGSSRGICELAIPTGESGERMRMEPVWGRKEPGAEGTSSGRALARLEALLEQKASG